MTDLTQNLPATLKSIPKGWLASLLILALLAIFDTQQLPETLVFTADALIGTAPFIAFAVIAVAYIKASGAESMLAKVFEGNQVQMVALAALAGGLSPFCSCEVIPFIAGLLAVGAPLSAVMAFWLSSPLMDPMMFAITAGAISWEFAVAKAVFAVGLGLMGGYATMAFRASAVFDDPLRPNTAVGGCGCGPAPFSGKPVWQFWSDSKRVDTFRSTAIENALFLFKWLTLAYVLESVMLAYVPAESIATLLGGDGAGPVILGALIGGPAYLNGYAAVPLVGELMNQGMAVGAAMSFIIAGGVSCIPAAVAVWPLVKLRVFTAYIGFGVIGAMIAGFIANATL
ncbi:permease [Shimia ponticola]|uniref:permease n=1 Tax=Shimia ponticola TaxID=2582893 RepID=UPI0011BEF3CA|nr:permease [Shimia ponticola]